MHTTNLELPLNLGNCVRSCSSAVKRSEIYSITLQRRAIHCLQHYRSFPHRWQCAPRPDLSHTHCAHHSHILLTARAYGKIAGHNSYLALRIASKGKRIPSALSPSLHELLGVFARCLAERNDNPTVRAPTEAYRRKGVQRTDGTADQPISPPRQATRLQASVRERRGGGTCIHY